MDALPAEVLARVFALLPLRALLQCVAPVCRRFNFAVQLSIPSALPRTAASLSREVFNAELPSALPLDDDERHLRALPTKIDGLTRLAIDIRPPPGPIITALAELRIPTLRSLDVLAHLTTDAVLRLLAEHAARLERLSFSYSNAVATPRTALTQCAYPALRSLSLCVPFAFLSPGPGLAAAEPFVTSLLARAPHLTHLTLRVPIACADLLKILPLVAHCLVCLEIPSVSAADVQALGAALQGCPRLTQLFPPWPKDADDSSAKLVEEVWAPLVTCVGARLEHLSVPWMLRGLHGQWQQVWSACTRLASLELAAFSFWFNDGSGLEDVPLAQIECLQLNASDFDVDKSHALCFAMLPRMPRLRHLRFFFDEVNVLEYRRALALLHRLWRLVREHCPHMRSVLWRSAGDPDTYAHIAEEEAPRLQAQNPWIELRL